MGWWHHGWGLGLGGWESLLVGGLMMLLFWGGLLLLGFFLVRAAVGAGRSGSLARSAGEDSALNTLRRRYAQGEMDAEEFEERKRTLQA